MGKRLPSVEEWEWAARNGAEGTAYPWGDSTPNPALVNACGDECWPSLQAKMGENWRGLQQTFGDGPLYSGDDGFQETAPVGSFPKGDNRWGVHDLAGNVLEWTSSYRDSVQGPFVAVVGGAFNSSVAFGRGLRSSVRGSGSPSDRWSNLGFRCAR